LSLIHIFSVRWPSHPTSSSKLFQVTNY
jgi:hypothetical protein